MKVIKRNGQKENLDVNKIKIAITKAFEAVGKTMSNLDWDRIIIDLKLYDNISIENIQNQIEDILMKYDYFEVAKSYILYRDKHKELRFIKERSDYIDKCVISNSNTATLSEVDENANVSNKNVATIEAETHKSLNKQIQRYKMKKKLQELFPEVANQYEKDLESHIIYTHDESSSPVTKPYCVAVSLYPFLLEGTSNLDKLKTKAPSNLNSFCGQFNNLVFLLSSQFKGAIAFGEFFNIFYYYCVQEWGEGFWLKEKEIHNCGSLKVKNISETIEQAFQNIIYTINQPAGNRSYQSPFTNISYYDKGYWSSLFKDFIFPDGTKPEWDGVNYLQKKFMKWFNKERKTTLLTFPVESMALLSDGSELIDKEYENFVAEMYAEGHSFFTYISDNPDALASCCRLRNEIEENTFSFTSGLTGVATGSVNVITLNINRIIQNFMREFYPSPFRGPEWRGLFKNYLGDIVNRVHKYHIAYKSQLYDLYENNMLPVYSAGYIDLKQQYSTIGINGVNEAAEYLLIQCNDNPEYLEFVQLVTNTISKLNREVRTDKFKMNLEFVPKICGHVKSFLIDLEIPMGQQGASIMAAWTTKWKEPILIGMR